jgi:hypothetical protein
MQPNWKWSYSTICGLGEMLVGVMTVAFLSEHRKISYCTVGEVNFWIFNFLQFAIDGKNKVEKVFFFIFMSSYAEMSFFKIKNH